PQAFAMKWVCHHYDRIAAMAGACFLLLCGLLICRQALRFNEVIFPRRFISKRQRVGSFGLTEEVEEARRRLHRPAQWTFVGRSGLFVPEKHFIGRDGFPTRLQDTQIHPPVSNDWLEKFGLPIAETDVLGQDPDEDGFTNLDEWLGRSDPKDKNS